MPPKKAGGGKAEEKKKQKVVEDKTFGLKNKNKSKTVQKYIQGVQSQVANKKAMQAQQDRKKKEKEEEERRKMEAQLFKPAVVQQKVPLGVDPKSVVCEFFKKGMCTKGDKCKFSHDLDIHRKKEKIDLYVDIRKELTKEEKEQDTMDKWDEQKLQTVVESKQTQENKNLKTQIVCKYFLEAVESKKYGWFWECPNGEKCIYQHCLPPGFILKSQKKDEEEEEEEKTPLEELLEEERAKLQTRTPLTKETFLQWKEKKKREKEAKEREEREKRPEKAGRNMRSGREMFEFDPNAFVDEESALDSGDLIRDESDVPIIELDVTGTSIRTTIKTRGERKEGQEGSEGDEEQYEEGEEHRKEEEEEEPAEGESGPINEELFVEDEIPDDLE